VGLELQMNETIASDEHVCIQHRVWDLYLSPASSSLCYKSADHSIAAYYPTSSVS